MATPRLKFTHTRLLVEDFARMFRFYRDMLGLPVHVGDESGAYAEFGTGPHFLALFEERQMAEAIGRPDRPDRASGREEVVLAFEVEDVDAAFEALRREGIGLVAEPADRREWQIRTAHFRDPEGNLIEINADLPNER